MREIIFMTLRILNKEEYHKYIEMMLKILIVKRKKELRETKR